MDLSTQSFVDAAIERLQRADLMRIPVRDMPPAMRDPNSPAQDDWIAWRAVHSTVTDPQLDELEREISLQFPPAYREFLKYRHFYELAGPIRFVRHPSEGWQDELRKEYRGWQPERIIGAGLIPFAEESFMDAGPICFDTRQRLPDGDFPVVLWDHEWVNTDKEIKAIFSSAAAMFRCLEYAAKSDVDIFDLDEPEAKSRFETFLAIDPAGAGGSGRGYWNSWMPQPLDYARPNRSTDVGQHVGVVLGLSGLLLALAASWANHSATMIAACVIMFAGVVQIIRTQCK